MTRSQLISSLRIGERIVYLLAFMGLSGTFLTYTFGSLGPTADYGIVRVGFAITYMLLVVAFALVIMNKSRSSLLKTLVTIVTCMLLLAFALSLLGVLQDTVGISCTNSLGAQTSCSANNSLVMSLIFMFPQITETAEILLGLFITGGLLHELWLYRKRSLHAQ